VKIRPISSPIHVRLTARKNLCQQLLSRKFTGRIGTEAGEGQLAAKARYVHDCAALLRTQQCNAARVTFIAPKKFVTI
jgi:hypothetical protein